LENEGNKEIGLYFAIFFLSQFLKIGLIMAYFSLEGKVPDIIDLSKIYVKVELIKGALIFKILVVISS
jgi:hypothetical protein